MAKKKYPIGIQSFEKLRKENYYYVDKTDLMYSLVNEGSYYFLSRPRRFGKSLLISTLEAYFSGKKELFKDLKVEKLEKKWVKHPILHLDLNVEKYDTVDSLQNILSEALSGWEKTYGTEPSQTTLSLRFKGIVERAYRQTGEKAVILVDEYDKPLLQSIGDEQLQDAYRTMLKPFYGVLKTMDGCIQFALLTGVTKFGKVSVFSDLNNLFDISMSSKYATICGITQKELENDFEEDIKELGQNNEMSVRDTLSKMKLMYDGYHFSERSEGMYNPFSVLNTFSNQRFGSYWFETGTPTYLMELLKQSDYDLRNMTTETVYSDVLESIDASDNDPIPVIYQSGYLTIKGYDREFDSYQLGFPNKEVELGFTKFLLPYYVNLRRNESANGVSAFVRSVRGGDVDGFMTYLKSFFADIPYDAIYKRNKKKEEERERYYQNVMYLIFKIVGFYVDVEYKTSQGRVDLVLRTDKHIYVMEFKLDGSAEEALRQIKEKGYAEPFAGDGREVTRIGVNFGKETQGIEKYVVE